MKRIAACILLCVISFAAVKPLSGPGYFPIHDDVQVERVVEMGKALKEGQFPVRWVGDLGYGYGYPIFNFYAPLPYYAGGVLYALGVPALLATKTMFAIGIVVPSVVLFLVLSAVTGTAAALTAAILYLFAPYHAVQIYVRGAVGEYWILLFWPMILYGLTRFSEEKTRKRAYLAGAFGIAGSILSHTLLGYVTVLFLGCATASVFLYRLVTGKSPARDLRPIPEMALLGMGLSAFFWLPALFEMKYTDVASQVSSTANWKDHFVCAIQLWSSSWGYGGSSIGCVRDGLSFMLGKIHIVISAASALLLVSGAVRGAKNRLLATIGLVAAITGIFFALPVSSFAWRVLPGFSYLQYPWRFLALSGFGIAVLSAGAVSAVPGRLFRQTAAVIIMAATVIYGMKWFVPKYTYTPERNSFESRKDLVYRASKISDEYLPKAIKRPVREGDIISATIVSGSPVRVTPIVDDFTAHTYVVESTGTAKIRVNVAAFPGWQYRINDAKVAPEIADGFPEFRVAQGQSVVALQFTDTPIRIIGNILSAGALVFILFVYVRKKRKTGR